MKLLRVESSFVFYGVLYGATSLPWGMAYHGSRASADGAKRLGIRREDEGRGKTKPS